MASEHTHGGFEQRRKRSGAANPDVDARVAGRGNPAPIPPGDAKRQLQVPDPPLDLSQQPLLTQHAHDRAPQSGTTRLFCRTAADQGITDGIRGLGEVCGEGVPDGNG